MPKTLAWRLVLVSQAWWASLRSMGAASGIAKMRDAGVRMALLASGVLAGVADALRDQSETKKDT